MIPGNAKPSRSDIRIFSGRLLFVKLAVIAGFLVLTARLAWLQIYQHEHYSGLSSSNRIRSNFLTPARGRIFDRGGQILATNQPAFSLQVLPRAGEDVTELIDQVRELIGLSVAEENEFYQRLPQTPVDGFSTTPLRENLTTREVAIVAAQLHRLSGLSIGNFLRRVYPEGMKTSSVLGHMGRINTEDWQRLDQKRYAWNGFIGKTGLEYQHEDSLYGRPGYSYVEVDAHGRIHRELDRRPSIPGMDLHTSISLELQRLAAESMDGYRGAVVAMIPRTGEILLLHSAPSFDTNRRLGSLVRESAPDENDLGDPLFNRATNGVYPPASTMKPFFALHPSLVDKLPATEEMICKGSMRIGRRTFRDWKRAGHGKISLRSAIAESCDVYFYRVSLALGIEGLNESMSQFGFGAATGIDLPSEGVGLLPTAAWKRKRFDDDWRDGDTANAGIGQGFVLATPLQMAAAVAALANRGEWMRPRLFSRAHLPAVDDGAASDADSHGLADDAVLEQGLAVLEAEEGVLRPLAQQWQLRMEQVLDGMREVVHSQKGTARALRRQFEKLGVEAAGKTGTAQVVRLNRDLSEDDLQELPKDHSLFIGFAPFDNPIIAVAVVVENAGNGSAVAAPIGGKIMLEWLKMNGITGSAAAESEAKADSTTAQP